MSVLSLLDILIHLCWINNKFHLKKSLQLPMEVCFWMLYGSCSFLTIVTVYLTKWQLPYLFLYFLLQGWNRLPSAYPKRVAFLNIIVNPVIPLFSLFLHYIYIFFFTADYSCICVFWKFLVTRPTCLKCILNCNITRLIWFPHLVAI